MIAPNHIGAGAISLDEWARRVGRSRWTVRSWINKGYLNPDIVIDGRRYLSAAQEAKFWERAKAGEFEGDNSGIELLEEADGKS